MAVCPPRELVIRPAGAGDLPAVARLLSQAGDWMRRQGITDQWPSQFPLSDLAQRADRGELHIAYDNDVPVGTFAVDYNADPEFWQDDPNGELAGYLHRLAVARTHAGQGIAAQLVDHAARLVANTGRRWLRLDCAKHNADLHDYYRRLDFIHLQTIDLPHRKSGALFERAVTPPDSRASTGPPAFYAAGRGSAAGMVSATNTSDAERVIHARRTASMGLSAATLDRQDRHHQGAHGKKRARVCAKGSS